MELGSNRRPPDCEAGLPKARLALLVQTLFRQSGGCERLCVGREVRVSLLQKTRFEFSDDGQRDIKRRSAHAGGACLPTEYNNAIVSSGHYAALDNKCASGALS